MQKMFTANIFNRLKIGFSLLVIDPMNVFLLMWKFFYSLIVFLNIVYIPLILVFDMEIIMGYEIFV